MSKNISQLFIHETLSPVLALPCLDIWHNYFSSRWNCPYLNKLNLMLWSALAKTQAVLVHIDRQRAPFVPAQETAEKKVFRCKRNNRSSVPPSCYHILWLQLEELSNTGPSLVFLLHETV